MRYFKVGVPHIGAERGCGVWGNGLRNDCELYGRFRAWIIIRFAR